MPRALRFALLSLFAACLVALASRGISQTPDPELLQTGRALSAQFERGEIAVIYARMTPAMQRQVASAVEFALFRAQVLREAGAETELIGEYGDSAADVQTYRRVARRARATQPVEIAWTLDVDGRIAGFSIRPEPPPAPTAKLDYQTKARLRLPFDGEWYVLQGGRTFQENEHVVARDQRFAYDFVVRRNRLTHVGEGSRVEDYFCWDRPILAPADATVLETSDGLPDNVPGGTNAAHPAGNYVMLLLGNGEYAVLGHLRRGSLRVKAGDTVVAGVELARCGNSGGTSEPRLHFHLQDSPTLGNANGLPAFFVEYYADGKPVSRGEPVRGQSVGPSQRPLQ